MLFLPHPDMGKRLYDPDEVPPQRPWKPLQTMLIVAALGFVFDHLASDMRFRANFIDAGRTADATEGD